MSLTLSQSKRVISLSGFVSFLAGGGTAPYTFSVKPGGAGGTVDPNTGTYTGPAFLTDPKLSFDTVIAEDSLGDTGEANVSIGGPLTLLCDIIQSEMDLADGRVYLWNQKIMQPTDSAIFIAVSVLDDEVFGNTNRQDSNGSGLDSDQFVSVRSTIGIDIISIGPEARERRFEVLLALASNYSQQQQAANGFSLGRLPSGKRMVAINTPDGSRIPYRFHIDISMQYAYSKNSPVDYFDTFPEFEVTVNS